MRRISCIIPALNEERNVENTYHRILEAIEITGLYDALEFIFIDDGSQDETYLKINLLEKLDSRVKVIRHSANLGLGKSFQEGVSIAQFEAIYFGYGLMPFDPKELTRVFAEIENADIILGYAVGLTKDERGHFRIFLSKAFVWILNILFGFRIGYYNGQAIFPANLLKNQIIFSKRSGPVAELVIKLGSKGATIREVKLTALVPEVRFGKTSAMKWGNVKNVFNLLIHLLWEIRIKGPWERIRNRFREAS